MTPKPPGEDSGDNESGEKKPGEHGDRHSEGDRESESSSDETRSDDDSSDAAGSSSERPLPGSGGEASPPEATGEEGDGGRDFLLRGAPPDRGNDGPPDPEVSLRDEDLVPHNLRPYGPTGVDRDIPEDIRRLAQELGE